MNLDTARWQSPRNGLIGDEGTVKSVLHFRAINDRNTATTTVGLSSAASAAAHYDGSGCGGSRAFALLSREVYN